MGGTGLESEPEKRINVFEVSKTLEINNNNETSASLFACIPSVRFPER